MPSWRGWTKTLQCLSKPGRRMPMLERGVTGRHAQGGMQGAGSRRLERARWASAEPQRRALPEHSAARSPANRPQGADCQLRPGPQAGARACRALLHRHCRRVAQPQGRWLSLSLSVARSRSLCLAVSGRACIWAPTLGACVGPQAAPPQGLSCARDGLRHATTCSPTGASTAPRPRLIPNARPCARAEPGRAAHAGGGRDGAGRAPRHPLHRHARPVSPRRAVCAGKRQGGLDLGWDAGRAAAGSGGCRCCDPASCMHAPSPPALPLLLP